MLRETMFTNTNWFSLQDDMHTNWSVPTSLVSSSPRVEDGQTNNIATSTNTGSNSSSNDEIVLKYDGNVVDKKVRPVLNMNLGKMDSKDI